MHFAAHRIVPTSKPCHGLKPVSGSRKGCTCLVGMEARNVPFDYLTCVERLACYALHHSTAYLDFGALCTLRSWPSSV